MNVAPIDLFTILRICSDAGLLVLIWIVQLVIYPSFRYYELPNLKAWHDLYTKRITVVVMPLMLVQLSLSVFSFIKDVNDPIQILDTLLVVLTWVSTFLIFVPLHGLITREKHVTSSVKKLIKYNWLRTILWSVIYLLTLQSII